MKMTKSIIILLIIIGLTLIIINCKGQKMKTFNWDASACAPLMHPIELYSGNFYYENGESSYIRVGAIEHGNWGEPSRHITAGGGSSIVPVRLDITWLSYTENKFYRGSFTLPKDTMAKLFEEGFTAFNDKEHETYNSIIAGLAPGGMVAVWMRGRGKAVEIGRYQASENKVSMQAMVPTADVTQDEWVKKVMSHEPEINDYIRKNGIPYGLWDTYREKFSFKPVIDFDSKTDAVMDDIYMEFFNGEADVLNEERLIANRFEKRARIKKLEFQWSNKRELSEAEIKLDEEEIFKAYRFIYQDNPDQEGQFRIKINKDDSHIWIFLENTDPKNHREVQLQKAHIKIYPVDEVYRKYFTKFKDEFKK
jgi:hypothetical protein